MTLKEDETILRDGPPLEQGKVLVRIKDSEQFRESGFETFEEYCAARAPKLNTSLLMRGARKALSPALSDLPPVPNEMIARELPHFDDPRRLRAVWLRVTRNGKPPTHESVIQARREVEAEIERADALQKQLELDTIMTEDPRVLNWVADRMLEGMNRTQIVRASRKGEFDWPLPGESLSNGGVTECRAAMKHLFRIQNQWPPVADPGAILSQEKPGARLRKIVAEQKTRDQDALLNIRYYVMKQVSLLQQIKISDFIHSKLIDQTLEQLYGDLVMESEWNDRALTDVQAHMEEAKVLNRIRGLEAKTVANGAYPHEEASAQRVAKKLRDKLNGRLGQGE